jgi:hypothetical protein
MGEVFSTEASFPKSVGQCLYDNVSDRSKIKKNRKYFRPAVSVFFNRACQTQGVHGGAYFLLVIHPP